MALLLLALHHQIADFPITVFSASGYVLEFLKEPLDRAFANVKVRSDFNSIMLLQLRIKVLLLSTIAVLSRSTLMPG